MKYFNNITFLVLFILIPYEQIFAHIGSSGVVYEGKAGNYQVQIFVNPPDVIPGTASVSVLVDGLDVQYVKIKPVYFLTGDEGSPRSDDALPVVGEPGHYAGKIWLMDIGAASVEIEIDGSRGKGKTVVPIAAVPTAKRTLPASLGWVLAALGLLLVGLLTTIIGASTGDSLLKAGEIETNQVRRRRMVGSVVGAGFCGILLFVGNGWWNSESKNYARHIYHSYKANTKVSVENGQNLLHLQIDSSSVKKRWLSYVIPDHGKLMHLFLVRQGTMDVFAHLHPVRKDTVNFEVSLPHLPAGKYLLYADILRFQGFQYTIADTVNIPTTISTNNTLKIGDTDDTYVITNPLKSRQSQKLLPNEKITICGQPGVKTILQDGSSIVWEEKPNQTLQAGKVYDLKFSVLGIDGKPAELQPYLGMMGHAVVLKDDGSVYIHLHPNGTFSTASMQVMENRIAENTAKPTVLPTKVFRDSIDKVIVKIQGMSEAVKDSFLMKGMNHTVAGHHRGEVTFPYSFPNEGNYRIWIQIKRNDRILTGVFDAKVEL